MTTSGVHSCARCGKSTPGPQTPHCSTGCSVAAQIPMNGDTLPATWQLGVALGGFLVLFNQFLFLSLQWIARSRGEIETADKFALASVIAGAAVAILLAFLWVRARPKTALDLTVFGVAVGGVGVWMMLGSGTAWKRFPEGFLIANLLVASWLSRGLLRSSSSKKRENR